MVGPGGDVVHLPLPFAGPPGQPDGVGDEYASPAEGHQRRDHQRGARPAVRDHDEGDDHRHDGKHDPQEGGFERVALARSQPESVAGFRLFEDRVEVPVAPFADPALGPDFALRVERGPQFGDEKLPLAVRQLPGEIDDPARGNRNAQQLSPRKRARERIEARGRHRDPLGGEADLQTHGLEFLEREASLHARGRARAVLLGGARENLSDFFFSVPAFAVHGGVNLYSIGG